MLTAERLRELLHYDPDTGVFIRRVQSSPRIKVGDVAGDVRQVRRDGFYRRISVENRRYAAHRLAWLYVHGEWPPDGFDIDHIDGDGRNNRITNLRLATRSQNGANRRLQVNNASGMKGVSFYRKTKKWKAQISVRGHVKSIGYFKTIEEAAAAYRAAASEHFGEFRRDE